MAYTSGNRYESVSTIRYSLHIGTPCTFRLKSLKVCGISSLTTVKLDIERGVIIPLTPYSLGINHTAYLIDRHILNYRLFNALVFCSKLHNGLTLISVIRIIAGKAGYTKH